MSTRERMTASLVIGLSTAAVFAPFNLLLGALLAAIALVIAVAGAL